MKTLAEAKRHIDSFPRPSGYNTYAWNVTKKIALEAWESYLSKRPFRKPINYLCREFYQMIRTPEGRSIVPESQYRRYA